MATDARQILPSHRRSGAGVTTGLPLPALPLIRPRAWATLAILFALAILYLGLLTQGQELFDNDYDWIAEAQQPWLHILGEVFRPIPEGWGFQARPVQVACFKALHQTFGDVPLPYYAFKSALFGLVTIGAAFFCLRGGLSLRVAISAASMFALSAPVYASALWVSDFELLAQFFILVALGSLLWLEASDLFRSSPVTYRLAQAGILLASLLGHRTKGSAKLIPLVIALYLLLHHRDAIKRNIPLVGAIALTVLPVFWILENPIPPFAPFAQDQSQGWMWKPASPAGIWLLLAGNAHLLTGTTGPESVHSLFGTLLPVPLWMAAIAGLLMLLNRKARIDSPRTLPRPVALCAVWLLVAVLSFASYPRLPIGFMSRYVTSALIPACVLIAYLVSRAIDAGPTFLRPGGVALLSGMVLAHGFFNYGHVRKTRESLGQIVVLCHRARSDISRTVQDATVVLLGLPYSYRKPLPDGNVYLKDPGDLAKMDPGRPLYILVAHDGIADQVDHDQAVGKALPLLRRLPDVGAGYQVDIRPVKTFDGLTDSLYDRWIHASRRSFLATLLKINLQPIGT